MENLSTLLGKYGDEGDKLLFRILNSGDAFADADLTAGSAAITKQVCEKGLRYDLTVPFARYVVQHQNEISFPFRRYQIQTAPRKAATASSTSATQTWSAPAPSSMNWNLCRL